MIFVFFSIIGEPRTAVLHKGKKGFGFVLRGAKGASPLMNMVPSDKCPGLQYMDDVDPGGVADMAGIQKGDFLLEVYIKTGKMKIFRKYNFFPKMIFITDFFILRKIYILKNNTRNPFFHKKHNFIKI